MINPPSKDDFLSALNRIETLAPAPRTLGQALQLLRNPDSGLHSIAKLITCDSALTVDVLRCANSAFYSRPVPIADIGEALQVIGFQETIRLVSLVAGHQATNRNLGSYGIAAGDYWAESLFNGLFLEALSGHVGVMDTGEAYTAGLLRFIGRLAIDQVLYTSGGNLFWDGKRPLLEWERDNVGISQAEAGGRLLRNWRFPESMVLAIEGQDLALETLSTELHPLAQCVHFSAAILPAGSDLPAIQSIVHSKISIPKQHPLVLENGLDDPLVQDLLAKSYATFESISETLYT